MIKQQSHFLYSTKYTWSHVYNAPKQKQKNILFCESRCFAAISMTPYHVFDSWLEVAKKGFGLVSLDLAVLDGFPPQEVVHLNCKDGRGATLVLGAEITCTRGTIRVLHVNPGHYFIPAAVLFVHPQRFDKPAHWTPSEWGDRCVSSRSDPSRTIKTCDIILLLANQTVTSDPVYW